MFLLLLLILFIMTEVLKVFPPKCSLCYQLRTFWTLSAPMSLFFLCYSTLSKSISAKWHCHFIPSPHFSFRNLCLLLLYDTGPWCKGSPWSLCIPQRLVLPVILHPKRAEFQRKFSFAFFLPLCFLQVRSCQVQDLRAILLLQGGRQWKPCEYNSFKDSHVPLGDVQLRSNKIFLQPWLSLFHSPKKLGSICYEYGLLMADLHLCHIHSVPSLWIQINSRGCWPTLSCFFCIHLLSYTFQ